jgi:cytochrome P450
MRKAQQHHILADGTYLPKGHWVVAPAWVLNRSAQTYENPDKFDALRFYAGRHRITTGGEGYFSFGIGKHAW